MINEVDASTQVLASLSHISQAHTMHHFQFIAMLCADLQYEQHLSRCMQRFISPDLPSNSAVDQSGLQSYIHLSGGDAYDPCAWNGVHCTNKVLERIRIDMIGRAFGVVDLDWVPPTVRFFSYSRSRILRRWTASRLPRALRFFAYGTASSALMECKRSHSTWKSCRAKWKSCIFSEYRCGGKFTSEDFQRQCGSLTSVTTTFEMRLWTLRTYQRTFSRCRSRTSGTVRLQ